MKPTLLSKFFNLILLLLFCFGITNAQTYKIVDTDQTTYFDTITVISAPLVGESFYGQDAQYSGFQPSYTNNGDGTVTDNVTGLIWQQDMGEKISFEQAFIKADSLSLADYTDWRVPTIKELYSLILFTGQVSGTNSIKKFIDTTYFNQPLGNTAIGEREIDAQTWSSTQYTGLTMGGDSTVFGVNFIDGRIKGYPKYKPATGAANNMYFRMVRGNIEYGINSFGENGDSTVSDLATGLMWQQTDDGIARDWQEALFYAEVSELAGYDDWRLPNAKELQSIVDYTRSPQTTNSPAIDPVFETTEINDPDGNPGHYPYFWTGTSHLDGVNPYASAAYIAFGAGLGKMNGILMDVHGAGCQRSDPKSGNINNYPQFWGPQGDVRYVYNYVRLVRDADSLTSFTDVENSLPQEFELQQNYPNPFNPNTTISYSIPTDGFVNLSVYNLIGEKVAQLVNTNVRAGNHQVSFDASALTSGVYFYKIETAGFTSVKKMMVLK